MKALSPRHHRLALWALWALVAFGWLNLQAWPEAGVAPASKPAPGLAGLLTLMRDDGDTRRYFAYAEAMLGRPYDGYFVRPAAAAADTSAGRHELVTPPTPLRPWRDFEIEYPPGVLAVALPPAWLTDDFPTYHLLFGLEMELLLTLAIALAVRTADRFDPALGVRTLGFSVVMLLAIGPIAARRYDALVSVCLAASVAALAARRAFGAGAALGAAIVAKGVPLLLAPIGALHVAYGRNWGALARAGAGAGLMLGASALLYFTLADGHGLDALAYHADRPVQIESPYGAATLLVKPLLPGLVRIVHTYGSHNIEATFEPALRKLSTALTLAAILAVFALYVRGLARLPAERAELERLRLTLAASVALLAAYVLLGKVFSPQYLTWFLPIGALAATLGSERSRALLAFGALAGQIEYPYLYQTAGPYALQGIGAIALVRFALLAAATISLLAEAYPPRRLGA